MDMHISPDDVEDNVELFNELEEWVNARKDRIRPMKMAAILMVCGSEIAYLHNKGDEMDLVNMITEFIVMGKKLSLQQKS